MKARLLFFCICIVISQLSLAQSKKSSKISVPKIKEASDEIERAIESENPEALAKSLVKSGDYYETSGDLSKAEFYYKKAIIEYEKTKNTEELSRISRKLAIIQEASDKKKEAVNSLNYSKEKSSDKELILLNSNDIKRIEAQSDKSKNSLQEQKKLAEENLSISQKTNDAENIRQGYSQIADIELKESRQSEAINTLKKAYQQEFVSIKDSTESIQNAQKINQKIANLYIKEGKFDKAIEVKKELLKEPFIQQNIPKKIEEIQNLAGIYSQKNDLPSTISAFVESFELALSHQYLLESAQSLEKINSYYKTQQQPYGALPYYERFLKLLPKLIENDSTLSDINLIRETEEKIERLLKEKELQEQLIEKKNKFNYLLIGFSTLLILLLIFILYSLRAIKKKNMQIELQSLRREMNPHFIFNSLNSINQFIANQDEIKANAYLTRFSKLMRGVMENSKDDFITLSKEIEVLENYLQLERNRFAEKFDYKLQIDEELLDNKEEIEIPTMLIQPFLENAIWHGLRYLESKGALLLSISKNDAKIQVTIDDNGIGIARSKELKTKHQNQHKGRGMNNTLERINLLNELYRSGISYTIEDKKYPEQGVKVSLSFPQSKK